MTAAHTVPSDTRDMSVPFVPAQPLLRAKELSAFAFGTTSGLATLTLMANLAFVQADLENRRASFAQKVYDRAPSEPCAIEERIRQSLARNGASPRVD